MRHPAIVFVLIALVSFAAPGLAREWIPLADSPEPTAAIAATSHDSGAEATVVDIEIPGVVRARANGEDPAVLFEVPGGRRIQEPGKPDLPVLTYLLAVPDRGAVELEILSSNERVLEYCEVPPVAPFRVEGQAARASRPDPATYGENALYPQEVASLGRPVVMRDLRLVQLRVYPVRFNQATGEAVATDRVTVRVTTGSGEGVNEKRSSRTARSAAFEPLYRSLILNYDELPRADVEAGCLLVIANDSFSGQITDYVDWKNQRGVETVLVDLSDIGSSPSSQDIKDYIETAYTTWDTPPDYVVLIGDAASGSYGSFPSWYYEGDVTDHPYSELEGDDYFPDVLVGRVAVDTPSETVVASSKVLSYERDCDAPSDAWYRRALVVAGNCCGSPNPTSPRLTKLRVREMLFDLDYASVDTVFWVGSKSGSRDLNGNIHESINRGVGFVNYRGWGGSSGWYYPDFGVSDVYALDNGKKLPVMTSIVCGTGNFDSSTDPCFGEAWIRAGTPTSPKGGPAMCGPSELWTHTKWNNSIDAGIYWGITHEDLRHFAQTLLRGKMECYMNFPHATDPGHTPAEEGVRFYFNVYNIIGDPELRLRVGPQEDIAVSHDASIPLGQNLIDVTVAPSARSFAPGTDVVVRMPDDSIARAEVPASGGVVTVPLGDVAIGTADVTVWAEGHKTYAGTFDIVQQSQCVGVKNYAIDDDASGASDGNGDGVINPGETIELDVVLKNYGTSTVTDVSGRVSDRDGLSTVVVDSAYYGTLAANSSAFGDVDFVISFPEGEFEDGDVCFYDIEATDGSKTTWQSAITLTVGAPVLAYYSVTVADGGNGVLDKGETVDLTVALSNGGPMDATSVTGTLIGPVSGLTISDDAGSWGTIASESMASNSGNVFTVSADAAVAVGHEFTLGLDLVGDGGLHQLVTFPIVVGTSSTDDPLGPDAYGYYCYDNTDTEHSEAPTYSWIEIDPSYGGSGTDVSLGDDETVNVALPFTFTYYGQTFTEIGVCSNGWIALGGTPAWHHHFRNWNIPAALGPDAMVAGFWDDLDPVDAGKVLYRNMGDGRFVVAWSRVATTYDSNRQRFEIVLYDPATYPTSTGDGEILFQFYEVHDTDSDGNYSTVGIECPDQSDGVLYVFSNIYPDEAPSLANGRAIKFTTDPPDAFPSSDVPELEAPREVALLGCHPNPFNPVTVVSYNMPTAGDVSIAVYDVAGRCVATLFEGEAGPGFHRVAWDGMGQSGDAVASGVYFCRLEALGEKRSTKMILLK